MPNLSNNWDDYPPPDIEHIMRRWLLEEATGNQGATVRPTVAPTAATDEIWRWPIRRNTDKAYWEVDDRD